MKFFCPNLFLCSMLFFLLACGGSDEPISTIQTPDIRSSGLPSPETVAVSEPTPAAPKVFDATVAEWDGGKITLSQLNLIMESRVQQMRMSTDDIEAINRAIGPERKTILTTITDNYILVQEARARGIDLTATDKEQLIRQIRAQYETEEAYRDALESSGQGEAELLLVMGNIELGRKVLVDERQKIMDSITQETLKEHYYENVDMFTSQSRSDINRVVITFGDHRSESDARALAEELFQKVERDVQWASLQMALHRLAVHLAFCLQVNDIYAETEFKARRKVLQDCAMEFSESFEAQYNYGYVTLYHKHPGSEKEYDEDFLVETQMYKSGELSQVVKNKNNYVFFMAINQFPPVTMPFEADTVQNMLPNMIMTEKMEAWRQHLREKYNLKIYEDALEAPVIQAAQAAMPSVTTTAVAGG